MREYHCTTCDFHITGPADEVADEIDAHEEQHHTSDTATKVEITPEILRDVADEARRTAHLGAHGTINALLKWADWLERQKADEKRIDELAQVFLKAAHANASEWEKQPQSIQDKHRAGIRAVLAAYDPEERATAPRPYNEGGPAVQPLRQWGDLRDVPDDVLAVFTPHGKARRDGSAPSGWRWDGGGNGGGNVTAVGLTSHAYYIEIPEATR